MGFSEKQKEIMRFPVSYTHLTGAEAEVVSDYLNRVNPSASPSSLDELRGFVEVLGPDVCRRAFDIALDSKKSTWPYIRTILQNNCLLYTSEKDITSTTFQQNIIMLYKKKQETILGL